MATQTQAIAKVSAGALALGSQFGYTPEYVALIKNTIAKDSTDDELQLFLTVCSHSKLNPMNKEIYFWKGRDGKVVIHTGILGLRIAAERTGRYAPGKPIKREYDEKGNLVSSTAYVQKLVAGTWFEVEETALWNEWNKDNTQWKGQYGKHQLDITAERHALRKAFPQLAPINTSETMGDSPEAYSANATPETPEQLNRRHDLTELLLKIGQRICTPDQLNSLESTIGTTPLSLLEERYQNAIVKFKEHTLSEIGQVHQGEAFSQYIVKMFPTGIDNASVYEMNAAIDSLSDTEAAQPDATATVVEAEAETVSDEEAKRIALAEELMELVSERAGGELDKIDEILDGRVLPNMTVEQLTKFKASLQTDAPF